MPTDKNLEHEDLQSDELYGKLFKLSRLGKLHPVLYQQLKKDLYSGDTERVKMFIKRVDPEWTSQYEDGPDLDFFEKYEDESVAGPSMEMAIDGLIDDVTSLIKKEIPEHDWKEGVKEIKALWIEKINGWRI